MLIFIKKSLLFLILLVSFLSCEKSKFERRIEGTWKVSLFKVNGVDSTQYVTYSNIKGYRFEPNDNDSDNPFHNLYEVKINGSEMLFGHWGERSKDKMFLGVEYKTDSTGPFHRSHYYKPFDIELIKKREMKYSLQDGNLKYEVLFVKV